MAEPITFDDVLSYIKAGGTEFRSKFPKTYGALGGFLGTAPDEFEGSVLDPLSAEVRKGAEAGYPLGIAAQLAPIGKAIAAAPAIGKVASQKGMLRLGGREDLIATHGTMAQSLLDKNNKLIPELTHLSLAIQRNALADPWGNVTLIPRAGKFDPRTSPSIIHSRDAWTPLSSNSNVGIDRDNLLGTGRSTLERAEDRQLDRFATYWRRGGENAVPGGDILANQRFNSFKGYENSPQGAARLSPQGIDQPLDPNTKDFMDYVVFRKQQMDDAREALGNSPVPVDNVLAYIMQHEPATASGVDKFEAYRKLRNVPKNYAELKNFGQTPLNADTFAGALVKQYVPSPWAKNPGTRPKRFAQEQVLLDELARRGIPTLPRTMDPYENFMLATEMQKKAR